MANITSKHFLTLDLSPERKSDWREEQPYFTSSPLYGKEFSIVNLPSQFFRRGQISLRDALAHELIFACLTIKSLAVQDVLPVIQKMRANDWEVDATHPALIPLRDPNPDNTFGDLLAFITICEDVYGVSYLEKIRNRTRGIIGLAPLDPRTVFERPKPGAASYATFWNAVSCYKLSDIDYFTIEEGGPVRRLESEDVITIKTNDLRSPICGQSGVRAAMRAIGVDQNLDNYIDAYLMAGGPSGVLKIKNKQLTDEEAQDVQDRWEKRYSLKNGRSGKVAVFDEDGDYQQIGAHLEGLASDVLKQHDQAAICSAMGVPGQLVQAFYAIRWGNSRAGQDAALREFWELNLSPRLTRYRTRLDKSFLVDFDGRTAGITTRVFWDTSNVKALQEDLDKKAVRYSKAYSDKAVSKNEYRAQLGLKPVPGGDYIPDDEEQAQLAQGRLEQRPEDDPDMLEWPEELDDEKKSLQVKRTPPSEEAEQIPAIQEAQDNAKETLTAILLLIKTGLIEQGLTKLRELREDFARLKLTLDTDQLQQIAETVAAAYTDGQATIATQTNVPDFETIRRITTILASALDIGVAARMISAYAIRALRGKTGDEILPELRQEFTEESPAFYEGLASASGFQAVADGRGSEASRKRYKRAYYSALLDRNVCDPCRKEDGKWSDRAEDLPPVPNPACLGTWRCRCVHIYVFDEV